ncbi:MAG TPA: FAD-binding oxidoreductase [bacterium]|nr:FAD-binding oxidoreductase [bacterium]
MIADFREKSFWLSQDPYEPTPPLQGPTRVDVAIVGGGFAGLSTAYFLRRAAPSLRVAVLEAGVVGYGGSGRNAGFAMTLFGLSLPMTVARFGRRRAMEAYRFMAGAVDHLQALIAEWGIACDLEPNGFLRVATSRTQLRHLEHEHALAQRMGIEDLAFLDASTVRQRVESPLYLGALFERRCALVNPARLTRGLKRIAQSAGAEIYEGTPVVALRRGARLRLDTPAGPVETDKVVLATNAFSAAFAPLRSKQVPIFTHIVLTEPLDQARLSPIGWHRREGIEDSRNLIHYYRLTADNRLLMGGGDAHYYYNSGLGRESRPATFAALEDYIGQVFPHLRGVRIGRRWGGPISGTLDMTPGIGTFRSDRRISYALGCMGHGVSLMPMAGQIPRDLVLERDTDLTRLFFVNRRVPPLPPEPFRFLVARSILGFMRWQDRRDERR